MDVGGSKIAGALVNSEGGTCNLETVPTPKDSARSVEAVLAMGQRLLGHASAAACPVLGLGVAVPGAVDPDKGIVLGAPNLGWKSLPLKEKLEALLGVRAELELDVRAAALGAMLTDLARDVRDFIYVTIGTGIGAGIVINGELYRGAHFCSGEIGHCVLVEDGPRCRCGQRGCFEALAAGSAISRRAGRLVAQSTVDSIMAAGSNGSGEIDPREVFKAASAGDPLACEVVHATAKYLGRGLSVLTNVLNPQKIILGGGIVKGGGEYLLGLVRHYLACSTLHDLPKRTEIVLSPDLDGLPVIGAANLILRGDETARRRRPVACETGL